MQTRAGRLTLLFLLAFCSANEASAQALLQPTPPPLVTAENEAWYLNGDPVPYGGNLYYPAGAQVFFSPNEMVRSGFHMGVPLYTRTTIEPFSIVYVPVAGGRLQPYERPRSGELTGTAGSTPSSMITPYDPAASAGMLPQSPSSPGHAPLMLAPDRTSAEPAAPSAASVGTGGTAAAAVPEPQHTRIGPRPRGVNAIFMNFDGARWYSTGRTREIDTQRMATRGEYKGFEVWAEKGNRDAIYLPTTRGGSVVVEYSRRRPNPRELLGR